MEGGFCELRFDSSPWDKQGDGQCTELIRVGVLSEWLYADV